MARIRSIKPQFWTDGKIARLPKSTALFFIALWTFADDYGYFTLDTRELSLKAPLWRAQCVLAMLSALAHAGLIRVSRRAGCGLIVGWEHQKIRDRRASKYNDTEIVWDEPNVDADRSHKKSPGLDRIGEDRRGLELTPQPIAAVTPKKPTGADAAKKLRARVWESYATAYSNRYHVEPVRNATVNTQIKRLAERLGDEAPDVVAFYVRLNKVFYVSSLHPIGVCLRDAESIRTQWATGKTMTQRQAQQMDDGATIQSQLERIREGTL